MRKYEFWTDGACSGNGVVESAPMGAGIVARCDGHEREWSIPLGPGTNNRAEILAVIHALRKVRDRAAAEITLYSDSDYTIGVLTRNWKPKANVELIQEAKTLIAECARFRMAKVTGHSGHTENERADRLAVQAVKGTGARV